MFLLWNVHGQGMVCVSVTVHLSANIFSPASAEQEESDKSGYNSVEKCIFHDHWALCVSLWHVFRGDLSTDPSGCWLPCSLVPSGKFDMFEP